MGMGMGMEGKGREGKEGSDCGEGSLFRQPLFRCSLTAPSNNGVTSSNMDAVSFYADSNYKHRVITEPGELFSQKCGNSLKYVMQKNIAQSRHPELKRFSPHELRSSTSHIHTYIRT